MHRTHFIISVTVLLAIFTGRTSLSAEVPLVRLRPVGPVARGLLEVGRERSQVFRFLADRIEQSDLIVYIRTTHFLPRGIDGRLQLVTAVPNVRYLRITLRRDLSSDRLVATLGHELMHAVEVADDRRARDNDSLRQLYRRIGHSHDGAAFDTHAAVNAGHRVLAELRTHGSSSVSVDLRH
jgi:hypothetical protein